MNEPLIPIITSANRVQSNVSPALAEAMKAHPSASKILELLAADMYVYPERIQPVDTRLVTRIISLVGQADVDLNTPLLAEDE
jgi:antitoxin PrlF